MIPAVDRELDLDVIRELFDGRVRKDLEWVKRTVTVSTAWSLLPR